MSEQSKDCNQIIRRKASRDGPFFVHGKIISMHDIEWFTDRVGFVILRGRTEIEITSFEMAKKLFELQSDTYQFSDKLRVYRAPQAECESCSA